MPDLLIKEEELNHLDKLIGDGLTYRQAAPIVQFFQLISQKRVAEATAAAATPSQSTLPTEAKIIHGNFTNGEPEPAA